MQVEIKDDIITLWSDQDDEIKILEQIRDISPLVSFKYSKTYFDGKCGNNSEHFEARLNLKTISEKFLK